MNVVEQELEQQIRGGSTAVVALIHAGVLYVGNVGDSRALLCKKDKSVAGDTVMFNMSALGL